MKNVFILSSKNPSRLYVRNDVTPLFYSNFQGDPVNIYITSDEEIKEKDWHILKDGEYKGELRQLITKPSSPYISAKVVLTTDTDLIKDGVQTISDDFLNWFIKHPSCDEIELLKLVYNPSYKDYTPDGDGIYLTPKSESLQKGEILVETNICDYDSSIPEEKKKYPIGGYAPGNYSCICTTCRTTFIGDKRAVQCEKCAIELVKEVTEATAVEKAAMEHLAFWRLRNNIHLSNPIHAERCKNDYKSGVAWQKTRSYTYAEMKESFSKGHDSARLKGSYKSNESFEEDWEIWSNQFKKEQS